MIFFYIFVLPFCLEPDPDLEPEPIRILAPALSKKASSLQYCLKVLCHEIFGFPFSHNLNRPIGLE